MCPMQSADPPLHQFGSMNANDSGKICELISLGPSISLRRTSFAGDEGDVTVQKYKESNTWFLRKCMQKCTPERRAVTVPKPSLAPYFRRSHHVVAFQVAEASLGIYMVS